MRKTIHALAGASLLLSSAQTSDEQLYESLLSTYAPDVSFNNLTRITVEEPYFSAQVFVEETTKGFCARIAERKDILANQVVHYVSDDCSSRVNDVLINGKRIPSIKEFWARFDYLEENIRVFQEKNLEGLARQAFEQQNYVIGEIVIRSTYDRTYNYVNSSLPRFMNK